MDIACAWRLLPKDGEETCEDAAGGAMAAEGQPFRCAVADGATETSFAGLWANLLVRAHLAGRLRANQLGDDLGPLAAQWRLQVQGRPLPWYAEAKAAQGACAAFVGLSIGAVRDRTWWQAYALGDSCLFHIRRDRMLRAFPLCASDRFGRTPVLLSTTPGRELRRLRITGGTWEVDDVFLLMTDALAGWFLRAYEQGGLPWRTLLDLDARDGMALEDWVALQRRRGDLRNDDVALLRAQVAAGI